MALPRITDQADWSDEILQDARGEMNGSIEVLDPSNIITDPYDPTDDSGGSSALGVVMSARPARIQHINMPADLAGSAEWGTKRRFRFQVEMLPGDSVLRKGQIVNVLNGGKDASLVGLSCTILSAVNSSHAALRTIEAVTEGA